MINLKRWIYYLAGWSIELTALLIAIAYYLGAPVNVQSGDTGELVAAAWGRFVPHPPGYPLYTWLQSLFLHIFDFGTVYARAASLNILFSVASIYVLGRLLKENKGIAIGCMLLLAFSRVYWKYSLLPDVFILNALFAALILAVYFKYEATSQRALWIPFLFCFGLTNHLTLVFLFPVVFEIILVHRKDKRLYGTLGIGLGFFFLMYGSLVFLNPNSLNSWGQVVDFESVVRHFLRMDYGTFKLMSSEGGGNPFEIWKMLSEETLLGFYSVIFVFIGLLWKFKFRPGIFSRKNILTIFTVVLYPVVFFSLSRIEMTGFRTEVIERFFILFQVLFLLAVGYTLVVLSRNLSVRMRALVASFIIVCAFIGFFKYRGENDYSKNTIIEDYASNLLNEAPKSPTILLIHSDTRFFAVRYAQVVLGIRPDVKVLGHKMLHFPWFADKFLRNSSLDFDTKKAIETNEINLEADVILKNIDRYSFLTVLDFKDFESYHVLFLPLGRLITKGKGTEIYIGNEIPLGLRFHNSDLDLPERRYSIFRELWSDYCNYPLLLGRLKADGGNKAAATETLQAALKEIPWCVPLDKELCGLQQDHDCGQGLEKIRSRYFPYF